MKGAQQVTLIGDHKQLPAVVSVGITLLTVTGIVSTEPMDLCRQSQEAKKERLQISLFERLLTSQSEQSASRSLLYTTDHRESLVRCQLGPARHSVPNAASDIGVPELELLPLRAAGRPLCSISAAATSLALLCAL